MRRTRQLAGAALSIGGGFLLSIGGARYAIGAVRADTAREAWNEAEAKAAVARARSAAWQPTAHERLPLGAPVARIVIPRIDLDEIVLEGVDDEQLDAAPGHVPGSAYPGERGNAVISAHRDRHFSHFGELVLGDTVVTESEGRRTTWVITAKHVIDKNAPALFHTADATLTLTTCWPIRYLGPAPDRLIITAKPKLTGLRSS